MWYQEKYIPPDNDANRIVLRLGHIERPLIAKIIIVIGVFWLNHRKFILPFLPFLISIAFLVLAIISALECFSDAYRAYMQRTPRMNLFLGIIRHYGKPSAN